MKYGDDDVNDCKHLKCRSKPMISDNTERFEARARILLRGRKYDLYGSGKIDPRRGIVYGRYKHNVPKERFDPKLFQTVLVTGYPSVCINQSHYTSPFSKGDYRYERVVLLGQHGDISYKTRCYYDKEVNPVGGSGSYVLRSEFDVVCDVDVPQLEGACPLNEIWYLAEAGIDAEFEIKWPIVGSENNFVIGMAKTKYLVEQSPDNKRIAWERRIAFHKASSVGGNLEITQQSWLSGA